jgi:hypothetical protein
MLLRQHALMRLLLLRRGLLRTAELGAQPQQQQQHQHQRQRQLVWRQLCLRRTHSSSSSSRGSAVRGASSSSDLGASLHCANTQALRAACHATLAGTSTYTNTADVTRHRPRQRRPRGVHHSDVTVTVHSVTAAVVVATASHTAPARTSTHNRAQQQQQQQQPCCVNTREAFSACWGKAHMPNM